MRRITTVLLLMTILLGMTFSVGCKDIDWKDAAKKIVIAWVKDQAILAIDQFKDNKEKAVEWMATRIEGVESLEEYLKWVNIEGVIEAAYDYILMNIYKVAKDNGMDVDADFPGYYLWHVTGADFPGVDEHLMALME